VSIEERAVASSATSTQEVARLAGIEPTTLGFGGLKS
jgi:hypothetical protein